MRLRRMHVLLTIIVLSDILWTTKHGLSEAAPVAVESCGKAIDRDVNYITRYTAQNWKDYASYVGFGLGRYSGCQKGRFFGTGTVKCKELPVYYAGQAAFESRKIEINKVYMAWLLQKKNAKVRRACIAKLVAHEFSHTCGHGETYADAMDHQAFRWYAKQLGVPKLKISACGTT